MRNVACALLLSVLILALESCPNPGGSGTTPPGAAPGAVSGSMYIVLSQDMKSSNPKDPTVVVSYDVFGSGPGSAVFQETGITGTSLTVDSLAPGDWGVTVNGNNLNGMQVKSASAKVTVAAGQTASVYAAMSSSVADGNLELTMKWPAGFSLSSVTLTPQDSAQPPIVLPLAAGISSVNTTLAVAAGSYTLSRVFKDVVTGFTSGGADALHIASGSVTKFDLTINTTVNVTIVPDTSKTIPINFSGMKSNIGLDAAMTVTATLGQPSLPKDTTYSWYLNGVRFENEASPTIVINGTQKGTYRLDVIIWANGALRSNSVPFTVAGG